MPSEKVPSAGNGNNHGNSGNYFDEFDEDTKSQGEADAWKEYNQLVAQINKNWLDPLAKELQTDQTKLIESSTAIKSALNETDIINRINQAEANNIQDALAQGIPRQFGGYQYLLNDSSEIKPYLEYQFRSDQALELNTLRDQMKSFKPQSPLAYNAYKAGLQSLKEADDAYTEHLTEVGNFFKEAGKLLFDIATDLNPITGIYKDIYRTFTGKEPISGVELSPFERLTAGGMAVLGMATLGESTFMTTTLRKLGTFVKASGEEIRFVENLTQILAQTSLRAEVLRKGTSDVVTIIGRNMDRVRETRDALKAKGINVVIFDEAHMSEAAKIAFAKFNELAKFNKENGLGKIPDHTIIKLDLYNENKKWIEQAIVDNHTILDVGNPTGTISPFYEMEKRVLLEDYYRSLARD